MKALTIAGGGLAGLGLGIALRRRGYPVCVVEAASYPRHRVCGEFISGIHAHELAALGIDDLFTAAARPRETAWFDGPHPMLRATLPDVAYGVSRYQLDAAMAERFVIWGGELRLGQRLGQEAAEGTVVATGRPPQDSPWLGLKAHFYGLALSADLEIHFGQNAYVGLTRVEDDRVNVSGLFRRTTAVTGGQSALVQAMAEAGLSELAARLLAARMDRASLKGVNRFHLGWQSASDVAVRIGDAAVMIPPFTGNGMSMALQSALAAVDPLSSWSRGECSWEAARAAIRSQQAQLFASRLRWARALQSVLMHGVGRRLCAMALQRRWVSFATLYRKVR